MSAGPVRAWQSTQDWLRSAAAAGTPQASATRAATSIPTMGGLDLMSGLPCDPPSSRAVASCPSRSPELSSTKPRLRQWSRHDKDVGDEPRQVPSRRRAAVRAAAAAMRCALGPRCIGSRQRAEQAEARTSPRSNGESRHARRALLPGPDRPGARPVEDALPRLKRLSRRFPPSPTPGRLSHTRWSASAATPRRSRRMSGSLRSSPALAGTVGDGARGRRPPGGGHRP